MVIQDKSLAFAIRIVNLYKYMSEQKKEFVLSKQILKSGTSIGANAREAQYAQSTADMVSKYSIALKEANETAYWLIIYKETSYISVEEYESLNNDCEELIKLLTKTLKTLKAKISNGD